MGYRASQQVSTKQSPYYMLFQQQMRLPIDAEILPQSSKMDDREDDSLEETVGALLESRSQAFKKAHANITKAQKQQKETYDRKHLQKELDVGTKVLLENTAQQQRKGGKMEPLRLGPYVINRCLGKGIYKLKNMKGELLKKKANIARLTVFKDQTEPDSNLPSTATKVPATSRKQHPPTTIDDTKSSKHQCKRQVIISDDEDDQEGKSHCLRMLSYPRISGNLEISHKTCSVTLTSVKTLTSLVYKLPATDYTVCGR